MASNLVLPGEGEGKGQQDLSDLVLERLSEHCGEFREGNHFVTHPVKELLDRIENLFHRYPAALFTWAVAGFHLWELPAEAQATFYCLCELFFHRPLVPVSAELFMNDEAHKAFFIGIGPLLKNHLAIAVAVNSASDSEVKKDKYLLSPYVCGLLFKGREDLISPSVVASFGSVIPWTEILEKELIFPEMTRDLLRLISKAVSRDRFDKIMEEFKVNGLRSGLTVLLSGPPGTGKTEFIRQLGKTEHRNIFMVDAAKIDASFFGEKPRNIRNLFRLLKYMSAISLSIPIVFIDEADGLLSKRVATRAAADREENTSVNILLEELNAFDGILFAATNNPDNIDSAMSRRFLLTVEFPVPDADVRAVLWKAKLPFLTLEEAWTLADRFFLSAGLMDNVAAICLLERIVNGQAPTLERIIRYCERQDGKGIVTAKKIGF